MGLKPLNRGRTCSQKMLAIMNGTTLEEDTVNDIKDGFEENVDFRYVYRNKFDNNLLKTWITDGNTEAKTLGHKKLVSYPYKPIAFEIGDYIYFDYYHVGDKNYENWQPWLLIALDFQNYFDVDGRLYLCNQYMKWQTVSKKTFSYPCYFEDSMKYTTLNLGQQGFAEPDADIVIFIQNNEDTQSFFINQRFIFNKGAFIIIQMNTEINGGLIKLYLNKVKVQPNDDLKNGIAWNGEPVIDPVDPVGNQDVLLPQNDSILLNSLIEFNIYNYVDGIKTSDTFTISLSGSAPSNYVYNLIDGNHFSIKNIKQDSSKTLIVTCTNNVSGKITKRQIWLKGVF